MQPSCNLNKKILEPQAHQVHSQYLRVSGRFTVDLQSDCSYGSSEKKKTKTSLNSAEGDDSTLIYLVGMKYL